jgi:putative methyltransferase (TIGR04325 family)
MLDWGGGLGAYYVYSRALLPELDLDYHCRELPLLVEGGRLVLPEATFYTDDESALARSYDLVMASSSMHYVRDWRATLKDLAGATDRYLYVTRMPVVAHVPSYVVLQRPDRHGYHTEYVGWFINRDEFLGAATDLGLNLVREFLIWECPDVPNAPEAADYRGFLFAKTAG